MMIILMYVCLTNGARNRELGVTPVLYAGAALTQA